MNPRLELHKMLEKASKEQALPSVIAYNRIDGPGSSLDLREFQQSFWSLPEIPNNLEIDPSMEWSMNLPRTVGITIDSGTKIEAYPFASDLICVQSIDYKTRVVAKLGEVIPSKENWLLKIIELFNISGVKFVLKNLREDTHSSGLGGSATATTGVCLLANALAGRPFNETQLIAMASRIEQDLGVSITGTQEQANVVFGGVKDYIWFPWGFPNKPDTGYGESIRSELISKDDYGELEQRMAIFHSGHVRASTDVNSIWREALLDSDGYKSHSLKLELAYQFREGLRLHKWEMVHESITEYRNIRTALCNAYLEGSNEIVKQSETLGCSAFPMGAGGGGGVLIFSRDPEVFKYLRKKLRNSYREIDFKIRNRGYEFTNLFEEL